jgi:hypothetical protein
VFFVLYEFLVWLLWVVIEPFLVSL